MSRRRHIIHKKRDASPQGDLIMGRNCVEEVLRRSPDRLREVFLAEGREESNVSHGRRRSELREKLRSLKVPCREVPRRDLDQIVQSDSHQGVVACVAPRSFLEIDDVVALVREAPFVSLLALDGVVDPQNFGAILRAAECFGVDAVVWSRNRGAPLGPVVAKVSVGASEIVPLCPVANLHRALELLKEAGAWIVGTVVSPSARSLDSFSFPEKSVVVMGAEGEGVHQLIERSLDFGVYVPMCGEISSLNVSQATSVVLHEVAKQHRQMRGLKVT